VTSLNDWGLIPTRGRDLFLFATVSRPVLSPIEPPIQRALGAQGKSPQAAKACSWPLTSN